MKDVPIRKKSMYDKKTTDALIFENNGISDFMSTHDLK